MFGRLMGKSVIDRSPIPARFAPSLFKFLLGTEPSLHDLELFDSDLALSLRWGGAFCNSLIHVYVIARNSALGTKM